MHQFRESDRLTACPFGKQLPQSEATPSGTRSLCPLSSRRRWRSTAPRGAAGGSPQRFASTPWRPQLPRRWTCEPCPCACRRGGMQPRGQRTQRSRGWSRRASGAESPARRTRSGGQSAWLVSAPLVSFSRSSSRSSQPVGSGFAVAGPERLTRRHARAIPSSRLASRSKATRLALTSVRHASDARLDVSPACRANEARIRCWLRTRTPRSSAMAASAVPRRRTSGLNSARPSTKSPGSKLMRPAPSVARPDTPGRPLTCRRRCRRCTS